MEILKSNKGKDKLVYNGYIYRKNTTNITSQSWRCEEKSCKGSASTPVNYQIGVQVIEKQVHNHPPNPARTEIAVAMSRMLDDASTSDAPPRRVISRIEMSQEALAVAPKRKSLTARIQRKRRRMDFGYEREPQNRASINIPERFKTAKHGINEVIFLFHDDEPQDEEDNSKDRIIIFATDLMLDELSKSDVWMMDGTFKVSPALFFQLYTIHVVVPNSKYVFPCAYCLLPNKTHATYKRVFQILKTACQNLVPRICIIDFEAAAKRALLEEFPQISVEGCFFHLTQSVWRKVQSVGLTEEYKNSADVRHFVKSLCSLAFLRVEIVPEAFEKLRDSIENIGVDELVQVYDYFEDTYIGRVGRRGIRRSPTFGRTMWNVRKRTIDGIPRTNSKLEA